MGCVGSRFSSIRCRPETEPYEQTRSNKQHSENESILPSNEQKNGKGLFSIEYFLRFTKLLLQIILQV